MAQITPTPDTLLPARAVRARFGGVSEMTLWRWLNTDAIGFPSPVIISKRRYWRAADLDMFQARLGGAS